MAEIYNNFIESLDSNEIFVFGSNQAGIHCAGAALMAKLRFGAVDGTGEGLMGNCYALPTKDRNFNVRSLDDIFESILKLKECATQNPSYMFYLTRIGQGYAGLSESNIKQLVEKADLPENVQPWWEWEKQSFILYPHFLNQKRDREEEKQ